MSFPRYIHRSHRILYLYDVFSDCQSALKTAKYYQKKNRSSYFILKSARLWSQKEIYALYLSRVFAWR